MRRLATYFACPKRKTFFLWPAFFVCPSMCSSIVKSMLYVKWTIVLSVVWEMIINMFKAGMLHSCPTIRLHNYQRNRRHHHWPYPWKLGLFNRNEYRKRSDIRVDILLSNALICFARKPHSPTLPTPWLALSLSLSSYFAIEMLVLSPMLSFCFIATAASTKTYVE